MLRIVQLWHTRHGRAVARVNQDELQVIEGLRSSYDLGLEAARAGTSCASLMASKKFSATLNYGEIHSGRADWKLLPAFDHPEETSRCLVTGTGLTHNGSARNRQAMHAGQAAAPSDSMRMYQWGVEGGRPEPGKTGVCPEWFYKGRGDILRAHGEPLEVPAFALDGGEEAEVAGAYLIDGKGNPCRMGLMLANEFSDHEFEEKNYLYLAHSKLRTCSIGPELIIGGEFKNCTGKINIVRAGNVVWSSAFATGEENMSHTVANLEHHHFKYPAHRRPLDAHVYFFGADVFSYGAAIKLQDNDIMEISLEGFGKPLANPIRVDRSATTPVQVRTL